MTDYACIKKFNFFKVNTQYQYKIQYHIYKDDLSQIYKKLFC